MPLYFFTSLDNESLARDIESGLEKVMEDGRFDHYFNTRLLTRDVLAKANIKSLRTFLLATHTRMNGHRLIDLSFGITDRINSLIHFESASAHSA